MTVASVAIFLSSVSLGDSSSPSFSSSNSAAVFLLNLGSSRRSCVDLGLPLNSWASPSSSSASSPNESSPKFFIPCTSFFL
uniref:Secreted protein n=1 Tax=Pararge aegeria TaxID=116150 RepID=S4P4Z7_9NEOP